MRSRYLSAALAAAFLVPLLVAAPAAARPAQDRTATASAVSSAVPVVADRGRGNPHASRGGAPRWGDSDDAVWRRSPAWMRVLARCIRAHESVRAGHYSAQNGVSSAAGAYQYLSSTWQTVSARAGYGGYSSARHAPAYVQDRVWVWHVRHYGASAWRGCGCGYGT